MSEAEKLLAEIMHRTEEEGLLDRYPQRFQDWWFKFKAPNGGIIVDE